MSHTALIEQFKSMYNFEFEVVESLDYTVTTKIYLDALEQGKTEGFTPVFLVLNEYLFESFECAIDDWNMPDMHALNKHDLEKYHLIEPQKWLENAINQWHPPLKFKKNVKYDMEEKHKLELLEWVEEELSEIDYAVILVKVPTQNPYELLSIFPMGGMNECPHPTEQTAISKYWYEKFGAIPAVISDDTIEYYVQNPPTDLEATQQLAKEHCAFCSDLLLQIFDSIDEIASGIYDNVQWYFWWD